MEILPGPQEKEAFADQEKIEKSLSSDEYTELT
jgi:hypothetical protein